MSRVYSAKIAGIKALDEGLEGPRLGARIRRVLPVPRRHRRRGRGRSERGHRAGPARCATPRSSPRPTSTGWRWCSPACGTSGTDPRRKTCARRDLPRPAPSTGSDRAGPCAPPESTRFAARLGDPEAHAHPAPAALRPPRPRRGGHRRRSRGRAAHLGRTRGARGRDGRGRLSRKLRQGTSHRRARRRPPRHEGISRRYVRRRRSRRDLGRPGTHACAGSGTACARRNAARSIAWRRWNGPGPGIGATSAIARWSESARARRTAPRAARDDG